MGLAPMFLECFSWYEQSVKDVEEWAEKKRKNKRFRKWYMCIPCHKRNWIGSCKLHSAPLFPLWRTFARRPSVTCIQTLLRLPSTGLFSHNVNYYIILVIRKRKLKYLRLSCYITLIQLATLLPWPGLGKFSLKQAR